MPAVWCAVRCTCIVLFIYWHFEILDSHNKSRTIIKYRSHKSMWCVLCVCVADAIGVDYYYRWCLIFDGNWFADMFDECVGSGISSSTNGTMFAVDVLCCNALSRLSILRFSCILNLYPLMCRRLNTFTLTHTHTQAKPGYYVNIVWLKSCVLHNWLHTQSIHAHARAHRMQTPFRFYLFRFLVIRVGKNIEYIGTLLSSHTCTHTHTIFHSLTRSRSFGRNLLRKCASVC